jgi:hypothetical protein
MQRPTGVTLLAVLAFLSGGLHFLAAFLAFAGGSWISAQAISGYYVPLAAPFANAFGNYGFWIGLIGMIFAGITLAAACGLWVLARWGWWLTIVGLSLNLIMDIVHWLGGYTSSFGLIGALLAIIALVYLTRPQIKHAFDGFPIDAPTRVA